MDTNYALKRKWTDTTGGGDDSNGGGDKLKCPYLSDVNADQIMEDTLETIRFLTHSKNTILESITKYIRATFSSQGSVLWVNRDPNPPLRDHWFWITTTPIPALMESHHVHMTAKYYFQGKIYTQPLFVVLGKYGPKISVVVFDPSEKEYKTLYLTAKQLREQIYTLINGDDEDEDTFHFNNLDQIPSRLIRRTMWLMVDPQAVHSDDQTFLIVNRLKCAADESVPFIPTHRQPMMDRDIPQAPHVCFRHFECLLGVGHLRTLENYFETIDLTVYQIMGYKETNLHRWFYIPSNALHFQICASHRATEVNCAKHFLISTKDVRCILNREFEQVLFYLDKLSLPSIYILDWFLNRAPLLQQLCPSQETNATLLPMGAAPPVNQTPIMPMMAGNLLLLKNGTLDGKDLKQVGVTIISRVNQGLRVPRLYNMAIGELNKLTLQLVQLDYMIGIEDKPAETRVRRWLNSVRDLPNCTDCGLWIN